MVTDSRRECRSESPPRTGGEDRRRVAHRGGSQRRRMSFAVGNLRILGRQGRPSIAWKKVERRHPYKNDARPGPRNAFSYRHCNRTSQGSGCGIVPTDSSMAKSAWTSDEAWWGMVLAKCLALDAVAEACGVISPSIQNGMSSSPALSSKPSPTALRVCS